VHLPIHLQAVRGMGGQLDGPVADDADVLHRGGTEAASYREEEETAV